MELHIWNRKRKGKLFSKAIKKTILCVNILSIIMLSVSSCSTPVLFFFIIHMLFTVPLYPFHFPSFPQVLSVIIATVSCLDRYLGTRRVYLVVLRSTWSLQCSSYLPPSSTSTLKNASVSGVRIWPVCHQCYYQLNVRENRYSGLPHTC